MNSFLAGGAQGIGAFLSGKSKAKMALRMRGEAIDAADNFIRAMNEENDQRAALTRADEARLRAATGYDLVKLRNDAVKAGFNPLTVLGATGGAGYDGRGAVLTTPFVSAAPAYQARLDADIATGQARIDTAGYLGSAIAAGVAGYSDQEARNRDYEVQRGQLRVQQDSLALERARTAQYLSDARSASMGGTSPFGGRSRRADASYYENWWPTGVPADGAVGDVSPKTGGDALPGAPGWFKTIALGDPRNKHVPNSQIMDYQGFWHASAAELGSAMGDIKLGLHDWWLRQDVRWGAPSGGAFYDGPAGGYHAPKAPPAAPVWPSQMPGYAIVRPGFPPTVVRNPF